MSQIAKRQTAAVKAYQAAHPEVDWSTHVVYIKPTSRPISEDSEWVAIGHQPRDERDGRVIAAPGSRSICRWLLAELAMTYGIEVHGVS